MKTTVTITSKGQITVPAWARKALGVPYGGKLAIDVNPVTKTIQLTKPISLIELQAFVQQQATNKAPVPKNIHEWYEAERAKELRAKGL